MEWWLGSPASLAGFPQLVTGWVLCPVSSAVLTALVLLPGFPHRLLARLSSFPPSLRPSLPPQLSGSDTG